MKILLQSSLSRLLTLYNAGRTPVGCIANGIKLAEVQKAITIFVVAFLLYGVPSMGDNLVAKAQNPPSSGNDEVDGNGVHRIHREMEYKW